jgi:hypothetical protein
VRDRNRVDYRILPDRPASAAPAAFRSSGPCSSGPRRRNNRRIVSDLSSVGWLGWLAFALLAIPLLILSFFFFAALVTLIALLLLAGFARLCWLQFKARTRAPGTAAPPKRLPPPPPQ